VLALVVTLVCLPLLALELLGGSASEGSDSSLLSTDGPAQPSLVVAQVPSTTAAPTTATTAEEVVVEVAETAPPTTAAPTTTTTAAPRTTTTAPPPPPPPTTAPPAPAPPASNGAVWDQLAMCESGGNWAMNSGNGYSGGLQFYHGTWIGNGGGQFATYAYQASREAQIAVAERVLASQGWNAWPGCARQLGLI
jgi:hypothetical protein